MNHWTNISGIWDAPLATVKEKKQLQICIMNFEKIEEILESFDRDY